MTATEIGLSKSIGVFVQTTVVSSLIVLFNQVILFVIPYFFILLLLVLLDTMVGVRAAKMRKENVRFSSGCRRMFSKLFIYSSWLLLASVLSVVEDTKIIFYLIVLVPFTTEIMSIISNFLYSKGKKITGLNLLQIIGSRLGFDFGDAKIEDIEEEK